jgi:hypothetical protein
MNAMLASRAKAMADRYTVRETRGMGLGAGGFVILDTQEGREFAPVLWRDEAERIVARLNASDRAFMAEAASGVVSPAERCQACDGTGLDCGVTDEPRELCGPCGGTGWEDCVERGETPDGAAPTDEGQPK